MSDAPETPEIPSPAAPAPICKHCRQWAHHPLHTGKNSQTGEDEGAIDHAFEAA